MASIPRPKAERALLLANLIQLAPQDEEGRKSYPNLADLLDPRFRENVCVREPGTLSLRVEGSLYKISLSCPTEGLQTVWTTDSLKDLFKRLEAFLASGKSAWTPTYAARKKSVQGLDRLIQ